MNCEALRAISLYERSGLKINCNCNCCFRFVLGKHNVTGINSFDFAGSAVLPDSMDRSEQLNEGDKEWAGQSDGA